MPQSRQGKILLKRHWMIPRIRWLVQLMSIASVLRCLRAHGQNIPKSNMNVTTAWVPSVVDGAVKYMDYPNWSHQILQP